MADPPVAKDFAVGSALQGLISAAAIVGAMCGAALLGPLGDRIGRSRIFRLDRRMRVGFSVLCTLAGIWFWPPLRESPGQGGKRWGVCCFPGSMCEWSARTPARTS
ncbi:hypothetical protein [Streptomyces sp. NPDC096311]|uniref:hypothetical protein n=1 Tax=Streptomyces sp. NPDC096311 TaxID=3366083 RepID=UPI003814BA11